MSVGHHSNTRLQDSRVIAPTVRHRRLLARTFLEHCDGIPLLSFSAADTHIHSATAGIERLACELLRRVKLSWRARNRLDVGFTPSWHEPLRSQGHLMNAFKYVLTQDLRHGCRVDPYFEGTALPDLLGMRVLSKMIVANVRAYLPRVTPEYVLAAVGLSPDRLAAVSLDEVCLDGLEQAAAAAVALPTIRGGCPAAIAARTAAVEVASRFIKTSAVARLLDIGRSTVKRLREGPAAPALVRAIELQLRFRHAVDQQIARRPLEQQPWLKPPADGVALTAKAGGA